MQRSSFLARIMRTRWKAVSRFQERVMGLVYALGDEFTANEVHLKLDEYAVVVYGTFRGRWAVMNFQTSPLNRKLRAWMEVYVAEMPQVLPPAFVEASKCLADQFDLYTELRGVNSGVLGTTIHDIESAEDISIAFSHLLDNSRELEALLMEGDCEPAAGDRTDVATCPGHGGNSMH